MIQNRLVLRAGFLFQWTWKNEHTNSINYIRNNVSNRVQSLSTVKHLRERNLMALDNGRMCLTIDVTIMELARQIHDCNLDCSRQHQIELLFLDPLMSHLA